MIRPSFLKELNEIEMTPKDWIIEILWYNPLSIELRRIGRFILRVVRWIPVLWKQEEWDFGYIYPILELKIKELRKSIEEDTWHTTECVQEELEQIDEVLVYLDKYRNWTEYVELPTDPIDRWVDNEDGTKSLEFTEEEYKLYEKAGEFEEENFQSFWNKLKEYHRNWWT